MNRHPGGDGHTLKMLSLGGLVDGARILNMGAGDGGAVKLMTALGYAALGIDLEPRGEGVERGDMLHTGYPDGSFDGIISQCAFFVSGDADGALCESARLLKKGGVLMLSDVCREGLEVSARASGFCVEYTEDMTDAWREYYIAAIWAGDADCCRYEGKFRYQLLICRKE